MHLELLLEKVKRIDYGCVYLLHFFGVTQVVLVCLLNDGIRSIEFLEQRMFERLEQFHGRVGRYGKGVDLCLGEVNIHQVVGIFLFAENTRRSAILTARNKNDNGQHTN